MAWCNECPCCAKIADTPNARNGEVLEVCFVVIVVESVSVNNGTSDIRKAGSEEAPQARFSKADQVKV